MATAKPSKARWWLLALALLIAWLYWRWRSKPKVAHETPQSFVFEPENAPNLSYLTTNGYAPGQVTVDALSHLAPETRADLNRQTYHDSLSGRYGPNADYSFGLWNAWEFFRASGLIGNRDDAADQIKAYWHGKGIG